MESNYEINNCLKQAMGQQQQQQTKQQTSHTNSTMTSSTSQIFATAAAFNLNQNDAVFYSRETIHLLAKFLANHSDNTIFRSLYAYAPDNLAWLWAFFDWEAQVDLDQIATQDAYMPISANDCENLLDEEEIKSINKIYSDAPLVQYKYRENIMIADVYKFIEHVQKIQIAPIARSLFLLYFPRFAEYFDTSQSIKFLKPKILKTNLSRVRSVDDIVKSLIKSRYTNLNEYKQKILTGANLPSYVSSLLNECGFWSSSSQQAKMLAHENGSLTENGIKSKGSSNSSLSSLNNSAANLLQNSSNSFITNNNAGAVGASFVSTPNKASSSKLIDSVDENSFKVTPAPTAGAYEFAAAAAAVVANSQTNESFDDSLGSSLFQTLQTMSKTNDYMKLLQKSTRINNDLDLSFDTAKNLALASQQIASLGVENNKLEDDLDDFYDDNNNNLSNANNNNMNSNNQNNLFLNSTGSNNTSTTSQLKDDNSGDLLLNENENYDENQLVDAETTPEFYAELSNVLQASNNPAIQSFVNQLQLPQLLLPSINRNGSISNICSPQMSRRNTQSIDLTQTINAKPFVYRQNQQQQQYMQQTQSNTPRCMSPLAMSPKIAHKNLVANTPKTPNSQLNQYLYQQLTNALDKSANNSSSAANQLFNNCDQLWSNGNSNLAMTPPPSASFKTSLPLSVITAIDNQQANLNSSFSGKLNQQYLINQLENLPNLSSALQEESLSRYLKHSAFISSPVTRIHSNRMNEYAMNGSSSSSSTITNGGNNFNSNGLSSVIGANSSRLANLIRNGNGDYSNLKSQRHSSTIDLNTTGLNAANLLNTNNNNVNHNNNINNNNNNNSSNNSSNNNNNDFIYSNELNNSFNTYTSYKSPTLLNATLQKQQNGNNSNVNSNYSTTMHHTWCGRLPPKIYLETAAYSRKVFLGGLPWDVNQQSLLKLLEKYGPVKLEIPGKDAKHPRVSTMCKTQERSTPGYVYIIFDQESSVQKMLADCRKELKNGGEHYFYTIFIPPTLNLVNNQSNQLYSSNHQNKRAKAKEVEVIPWNQDDTSYVPEKSILPPRIDAKSTIFVGALHGMLNAVGLAKVMNEIFGEVIHAGLDTDKYKYPIGSGRVTFRNRQSYVKAIKAKFVTIKANMDPSDPSPKFEKTIQIDPYLDDAKCCKCDNRSVYFCRNEFCLDYYCTNCWTFKHDTKGNGEHQYLCRQSKPNHG